MNRGVGFRIVIGILVILAAWHLVMGLSGENIRLSPGDFCGYDSECDEDAGEYCDLNTNECVGGDDREDESEDEGPEDATVTGNCGGSGVSNGAGVACNTDSFECPDGSFVCRDMSLSCGFPACPEEDEVGNDLYIPEDDGGSAGAGPIVIEGPSRDEGREVGLGIEVEIPLDGGDDGFDFENPIDEIREIFEGIFE